MRTIRSNRAECAKCSTALRPGRRRSASWTTIRCPRRVDDLRAGFVRGVVEVPIDFSRRYYQHDRPRIAFTEDNTDQ